MSIKKLLYIIIPIIIIIVAISAITIVSWQEQKEIKDIGEAGINTKDGKQEKEQEQIEEKQKEEADKVLTEAEIIQNQENLGETIKSGELSECDKLQSEFKNVCNYNILTGQAIDNLDKSVCEQINDENYKIGCISLVEENIALGAVKQASLIEEKETQEEKIKSSVVNSNAYKNLMEAYNNKSLSDSIYNEFIKQLAYVNEPELCWELPQELRQECIERVYILLAKRGDDTEICEKVPTPAWKDECYAQVLTRRAAEQNDPQICKQITNEFSKIKCENGF
ncbi:MAG: hypothetical protein ABIE43_04605 [Patescibacteria group bacterium]